MKRERKQINQTKSAPKPLTNKLKKDFSSNLKIFNFWSLLGLIIFIGIVAFRKYLTGEYLFFFTDIGSDSINQVFPGIIHKGNLFQEGYLSKWSFYKGFGDSFASTFPTDPYRILRQLIDYIGINTLGEAYLINGQFIKTFFYDFLLSGLIAYLYFRTMSIKQASSFLGGLLIVFSGYMVGGCGWGFSAHIFKAIFFLFAFEQLFLKKHWFFFPFAVIWLSTNPFVLFIYTAFLFIYSLFRFFSEDNNTIGEYVKLSGKMILLGFIGILMNFGHLFRSIIKMYNSPRVAGSASYNETLSAGQEITEQTSLTATTVLRFFSNDILGSGSNFKGWNNYLEAPLFYIGLLTLLVFPQVFTYLNKRKKIVFGSFLGFWMLTLLFPYLRHAVLAFTGDYFRYGFDFFIPFTLLFFAVYSLNQLDKTFNINYKLLGVTLIVLLLALFFPYASIPQKALNSDIRNIIVLLLLAYSALLILLSKVKYKTYAQFGILLLLVFELSYFSYKSYEKRTPITKIEYEKDKGGYADGSIKAVDFIKSIDKSPFYRIEKDYQSGNAIHGSLNDALAQGYYGTTSYSSFNQLNYVRFLEETGLIQKGDEIATRWLTGLRGYPLLQSFGNVKYHLSKSETPEFLRFGFDSLARKNGITILQNKYYLPFGYTYDKYIDAEDFKTLVNYQITPQSLSTIYTDLSRTIEVQDLMTITDKLQTILNIKYSNLDLFSQELEKLLGEDIASAHVGSIAKYSVSNFKVQTALLNGFVYEKGAKLDISKLEKIKIEDSTKIIPVTMFNFEVYKSITDNLKQDTLQITSFKQYEITGNISLSKSKMLFFTIPYDKGWKIKVNDAEKQLSRVNIGFSGIVLPKGEHKIELYYVPEYSLITNNVSLVSVIGFWLFLGFYFFRKRKARKS